MTRLTPSLLGPGSPSTLTNTAAFKVSKNNSSEGMTWAQLPATHLTNKPETRSRQSRSSQWRTTHGASGPIIGRRSNHLVNLLLNAAVVSTMRPFTKEKTAKARNLTSRLMLMGLRPNSIFLRSNLGDGTTKLFPSRSRLATRSVYGSTVIKVAGYKPSQDKRKMALVSAKRWGAQPTRVRISTSDRPEQVNILE